MIARSAITGAIVLRDRRGITKADFPDAEEKDFAGSDPLAIYQPIGVLCYQAR